MKQKSFQQLLKEEIRVDRLTPLQFSGILRANAKFEIQSEQLRKHNVSGWRPPANEVETAAKKHASEILGIPPNEIQSDDTIVNGFLAGVWWTIYHAACR